MKKLRLFISSPGDVQLERKAAENVISQLNITFSKYVELEPLLWERMPLLATSSFQEGIDQIVNKYSVDIAIFILWSRFGSTLEKKYLKQDGTPYRSGTEYEYDMMKSSFHKYGTPKMLVYVKDTPIKDRILHLSKETEIEDAISQFKAVKAFIQEHFHDTTTGSNYAYTTFGENVSFESRLKSHLTGIILNSIESVEDIIEWNERPYLGLHSYETRHSPIFFGREKSVNEIMPSIYNLKEGERPSIILLGESGSGKTSFVNAGIVPFVDNLHGRKFSLKYTTPSTLGNNIYRNFIELIFDGYNQLRDNPIYQELLSGIADNYNFAHFQYAVNHCDTPVHPLIFIDQFEELFTDVHIVEEQRIMFLRVIRGLVETKSLFVVLAMRNDFYPKFSDYVDFGIIKDNVTICYDLPPMRESDYANIVREPARMAGLKWEITKDGESLDVKIINEALGLKDLPLIEFALSELYRLKDENKTITHAAYTEVGGLSGAFRKYVNTVFLSLSPTEQSVFYELLGHVITVSGTKKDVFVRKVALYDECNRSKTHESVIKKLVDAHVFVSNKNAQQQATITIVHEMLIRSWDVITKWVEQERKQIEDNNYYERLAQHWKDSNFSKSALIKDDEMLMRAEYFDYHWHNNASNNTLSFLKNSFRYKSNLSAIRWGIYLIAYLAVLFLSIYLTEWGNGKTGKNIFDTFSIMLFAIPILINLYVCLRRRPLYKEAAKILNIWVFFLIIWIIALILGFVINKKDYQELPIQWFIDGLTFVLFLLATIKSFSDYKVRKNWKKDIFKITFWTKIFNRENYKIASSILSALYVVFFVALLILILFVFIEINKFENAQKEAEDLFDFAEAADLQVGVSTPYYYSINDAREIHLRNFYSDSIDINSSPNEKKYELARTFYYRSMPDSVIAYLNNDTLYSHQCLKALAYRQKGLYKEAAKCLPTNPNFLLENIFNRMSYFDPLDIYIMAKDYKSAEKYGNALLMKINEELSEFDEIYKAIFRRRINASLAICKKDISSAEEYYKNYTWPLLLSNIFEYGDFVVQLLREYDNTVRYIPLEDYILAGALSYHDAEFLVNCVNEEAYSILKKNKISDSVAQNYRIKLAVLDVPKKQWPNWINGEWSFVSPGIGSNVDTIMTIVFGGESYRFTRCYRFINNGDTSDIYQEHIAEPCRMIEKDGRQMIESLSLKLIMDTDGKEKKLVIYGYPAVVFKKAETSSCNRTVLAASHSMHVLTNSNNNKQSVIDILTSVPFA